MPQLRLFERLAAQDMLSDDNNPSRVITPKQSICNHLEQLFNTQLGSVVLDTEYGLVGDATQVIGNRPPDPQWIAKRMLAQIHNYEPRLSNTKVDMTLNNNKDIAVGFVIKADLQHAQELENLVINGSIMANGNIQFDNFN